MSRKRKKIVMTTGDDQTPCSLIGLIKPFQSHRPNKDSEELIVVFQFISVLR